MSDNLPNQAAGPGRFRPVAEILVSLQFLTRLPIPFSRTIDPVPLAQAMRFFSFAGALVAAANAAIFLGLCYVHVPVIVAAAIAVALGLTITGALHEDGLADSADGLFGGKSRESRLEIMRDSRIGTYGASALILALIVRIGLFQSLEVLPALQLVTILAAAGAFSRAMMVDLLWASRAARRDGLSAMAGRPSRGTAFFAILTGGALVIAAGVQLQHPEAGIIAIAVATAITGLIRALAGRLLGGQTGDICGATQVLSELGILTAFAAIIS
jgi:adenosylcobinamide-GDP ribazoletransferase